VLNAEQPLTLKFKNTQAKGAVSMTKAMDEQTAIRVLAEKYETIILANEDIGTCKVIHKGDSLQDLEKVRAHMSLERGVHINAKQVYTPTLAMVKAGAPATKKTSQLLGKPYLEELKPKPKHDPNKWQCECGEQNDYRDSKQRVKKKGTEHQCGTCLQWTKVESERVAG
jgi:hypothetical protein